MRFPLSSSKLRTKVKLLFKLCFRGTRFVRCVCTKKVPAGLLLLIIGLNLLICYWLLPYVHFEPHIMVLLGWIVGSRLPPSDSPHCTMDKCFDFTRCKQVASEFKFYLYPKDPPSLKYKYYYDNDYKAYDRAVEVFNELYEALESHPDRTQNPNDACLFFPGFDTSSWSPVANLPSYWQVSKGLRQLKYWNESGQNHVIFDRHEHDWQPFATDHAIVARASLHAKYYRPNFDLTYHLQSETKTSPCSFTTWDRRRGPSQRPILAFFAGRKTSLVRHKLFNLYESSEDIILRPKMKDNAEYCGFLKKATFGLNPRGIGLMSYRTIELLQWGLIPVYYGDHYILPYSEILDWKRFSVIIPEYEYYRTYEILKSFTKVELDILHSNAVFVYEKFFMSANKEMDLLICELKARIYKDNSLLKSRDVNLGSKYMYSMPIKFDLS